MEYVIYALRQARTTGTYDRLVNVQEIKILNEKVTVYVKKPGGGMCKYKTEIMNDGIEYPVIFSITSPPTGSFTLPYKNMDDAEDTITDENGVKWQRRFIYKV